MRPFFRCTLLVLALLAPLTLGAESAKSLYNKGKKAEARQDYIAAYEAYAEAYRQKPEDLRYRISFQRTRFLASAAHVTKGQELREQGKLDEAMQEFDYAARIDPSSFIAVQEVNRTRALLERRNGGGAVEKPAEPAKPNYITNRLNQAATPAELAPIANIPITLEMTNDSKIVYETLGKLANINVLFDPDYVSRRVPLKLSGVSLTEALDILAFNSNTFWRPVTANTIYVAQNTPAKRKDLDQSVLKTFYLSNVNQPSDLQDITNALRQILENPKVQQVNSQNAIIIRGTPDQVALTEKLIGDIDKAKPEVIVEVAIMQVRRDRLRNLGINPPTSFSASIQGPSTTATTGTTGTTGTTTGTTTTGNLTLNSLANLKATDIAVTIPRASLSFLYTDANSRLIQNPQIRATDGMKASLKIGDRIPIAIGQLNQGGAVGLGGFGVNTQFQYTDVGVNIDIIPRVYQNREVGLKLTLDVSSVTGTSVIGGVEQPIISQRKVEHDIRLKEGEVNLLGGIFEEQDIKSISGIPGLAQLPFLKYFFSENRSQKVENEIVFILIPHIVRSQELTELNQRAIDVGTFSQIDIRRSSPPATVTPAAPATQTPVEIPRPAPTTLNPSASDQPVTPQTAPAGQATTPAINPPAAPAASPPAAVNPAASPPTATQPQASPAALRFDPPGVSRGVGETFNVNVMIAGVQDLYTAPLQISYDPKVLQLMNVANGDFLSRDGQLVTLQYRKDESTGTIFAHATRPPASGGVSGDGVLYTLTFQTKFKGDSLLMIARPTGRDSAMRPIPLTTSTATVTVK